MDLISIIQAIWRHKFAAAPVFLLTILGLYYVYAVKAPVYEASSELLLLGAPNPPSGSQLAQDPKLSKVNPNNPYVNFDNLPVVADAVLEVVTSGASQQALAAAGVNPQYQVTLSTDLGNPPILLITGLGSTPEQAIQGANLVTKAAVADLYRMQREQGVSRQYLITATRLVRPQQAQTKLSGKLRTFIAVLGLGVILLFIVVSVADMAQKRRRPRPPKATNTEREDDWEETRAPKYMWARREFFGRSKADADREPASAVAPSDDAAPPSDDANPSRPRQDFRLLGG